MFLFGMGENNRVARIVPLLLILLLLASRMPFLDAGYGATPDAWRVARAARHIAQTGEYEASRLPGYPLHEIVCAFFWKCGPWALNGLSAAMSVAAAMAIWSIARQLQCRDAALCALAFAATPVVFVSSVSSKDYVWALAFLLWAIHAAMNRQALLAGLLLGLAIGCRITSGAMVLPLAMILYGNGGDLRWRAMLLRFAAVAGASAGLLFLPVWGRYGLGFFTYYKHARADFATILHRATIEVWGTVAAIALAFLVIAALILRRRSLPMSMPPSATNRQFAPAMAVTAAIYIVAYLRLPDMAGYLLPVIPALLFLAARSAPRLVFQLLCICLLIAPWIDFAHGRIVPGAVIADREERLRTMRDVQKFVTLTEEKLPGENTVVVGAWESVISELFPAPGTHNHYVYLLTAAELQSLVKNGSAIAYSSEVTRQFNYSVYGVDLAAFGARNVRQLLIGSP